MNNWTFGLLFLTSFAVAKLCSWGVYQACWANGLNRDLLNQGSTAALCSRIRLWPMHLAMVGLTVSLNWNELPIVHDLAVTLTALLTMGAVFRFGATDLRRFFWGDRVLSLLLALGVFFSPAFLYPCLVVNCCLQYTVSRWRLGPGYSNLLGFEFVRGSVCTLLIGLILFQITNRLEGIESGGEGLILVVLIAVQSSHYVNHALAKTTLGKHWYSWVMNNRIDCLVANAYLRGWTVLDRIGGVFRWTSIATQLRVPLCVGVFFLEFGFLICLTDPSLAIAFFAFAALFHVAVFVLTGLLEVEYVVNHLCLIQILWLIEPAQIANGFGLSAAAISGVTMVASFVWIGTNRLRILNEFQQRGQSTGLFRADPFDHLMAWWDSPYMRMYVYSVVTEDQEVMAVPVNKLSPYDTAMTDIHTHLMLLNAHSDFDPHVKCDRELCRSGVWGMVITEPERDRLYEQMNCSPHDVSALKSDQVAAPWKLSLSGPRDHVAWPLVEFFSGVNVYVGKRWFRMVMAWPHFPGEDLVPDWPPIAGFDNQRFKFDRRIQSVKVERIKTFYTVESFKLIERSELGSIDLGPIDNEGVFREDGHE